ncbi:MAG: amidohydrolase [Bacteroides sp.]|nr:amidohydrolase [Bacteroides sp.]
MKIVILQTDIYWANPKKNLECAEEMLKKYAEVDLFVLPEMFSTGFCTRPQGIAEPVESESLVWMKRVAAERNCAIAGSVAIEDGGKFFNRFYFVHPDGLVQSYDKKHLFTYGGEHKQFTPGTERVIVSYKGVRFLMQICYDLRFPVWSRNRGDYDVALYVASWPVPRIEAWKALLRARAIENQCYVVAVNRVGEDPNCSYCGGSEVINPYGKTIAVCEDYKVCGAEAVIDMDVLEDFRKKFPVLTDADDFCLQ